MSSVTTTRIVARAKIAGIDCDDVRVTQIEHGAWEAELLLEGAPVVRVDREIGLSLSQALERLGHVVDALARGQLRVLAERAKEARARTMEAWDSYRAASRASIEAVTALAALDPKTAPAAVIEECLAASRAASAIEAKAYGRWQSLSKSCDRVEREHQKAEEAYDAVRNTAPAGV